MVVTGADSLRSSCSGNSAIGSQHKQQEPTRSAGGLVGSSAEPQRGSKKHAPRNKSASLQASMPPALEQMSQSSASVSQIEREDAEADAAGASALCGRGQAPVSDTSTPQAGSMVEMVVTGADLLRSSCSGKSAIWSQHKQQEPIRRAGGLVGSSAEPQRGSKEHAPRNKSASLQASMPPALEQMLQSSTSVSQIEREVAEADAAGASALRGRGQGRVSDTSTPQAGSMVEMVVTGADSLRSGGSCNIAIGSQHKQQEPIRSAGGLGSSSAEPQRGSKEHAPRNKSA
jgi:hypothetical protein